jgi:hypothetical protein
VEDFADASVLSDQKAPVSRCFVRVSEGTRTPDRLDHNQELYQLSYAHRETAQSTSAPQLRCAEYPGSADLHSE